MAKSKKKVELKLDVLDALKERDELTLGAEHYEVPEYVKNNLRHGNTFRAYQEEALRYFHYWMTQPEFAVNRKDGQVLFNMATGSGKTDEMAGLMLYLFKEHGYQNFLFVVNTTGVVAKTRMNMLETASQKYLFANPITIEGQQVRIESVDRFPTTQDKDTIYLKLTTIQGLDSELVREVNGRYYGREGGLTVEELASEKLVILGDEAHHFSAFTKKKLNAEDEKQKNWEQMLDVIRQANEENLQLEFTATLDLEDSAIYEKYRDKVIYRYGLDKFILDGYSKKVYRLETGDDDRQKMLNAILLSYYRQRVAKKYAITDFKPVVMFKSSKIAISAAKFKQFVDLVAGLTVEELERHLTDQLSMTKSQTLQRALSQLSRMELPTLVSTLKYEFAKERLINVNDKKTILDDANDVDALNTLEDSNNPFRVVFAVAKLTEGWDVLNLYDIVRVSEEAGSTPAAVGTEAQLVGRGARYNPFEFRGEASNYKRRFDDWGTDEEQDLQLLESLHYHTSSESKYLAQLTKSLDNINLVMYEDAARQVYEAKLTPLFKRSRTYKEGLLYSNLTEEMTDDDYQGLGDYGFDEIIRKQGWTADLVSVTSEASALSVGESFVETHVLVVSRDRNIFRTAMQRNNFFASFNLMKQYLPALKSKREFLESDKWIGQVVLKAEVAASKGTLTKPERLQAAIKFFDYLERQIKRGYARVRGTNEFSSARLQDNVRDYEKIVPDETTTLMSSAIQAKITDHREWKGASWYPFDRAVVDGLEYRFISDVFASIAEQLQDKYDEVFLIRNDENAKGSVKLHQFAKNVRVKHYEGFQPDFILYLLKGNEVTQVFIEPKGPQLVERDAWKEELLMSLNNEDIVFAEETKQAKLLGVHFYTAGIHFDENHKPVDVVRELSDLVNHGEDLMAGYL
ncbi:restriction endonuclease subunit R [Weissella confusa]|uniref:DEAD/DEAH box helicase family protein n=1 Tax=Weissella confusa TaxID=1583 RepID=UPI0021B05A2F|nr:DEAD/DEAH box helicase family protein [Weissella confusa]MCT0042172.1 restriction endonuclease subunit R [Weissella confusa]